MLFPSFFNAGKPTYEIEQSLRFDGSSYLDRTFSTLSSTPSSGTLSFWIKPAKPNGTATEYIFNVRPSDGYQTILEITTDRKLQEATNFGGYQTRTNPGQLRDPSAWMHVVYQYQSSGTGNSVKFFINGVQMFSGAADSRANYFWGDNAGTWPARIGNSAGGTSQPFYGYLAEFHSCNGNHYAPTEFGEYDENGVWRPIKTSGLTYGTNGFYLKFDPSATNGIGHDHSGNGNNFTANNFTTSGTGTDVMSDTPTTNYCTLNPLAKTSSVATFSDGNLQGVTPASGVGNIYATMQIPSSGKWYWEVKGVSSNFSAIIGVSAYKANETSLWQNSNNALYYNYTGVGRKFVNGVSSDYGVSYTNNDLIGVACDVDAGTIEFFVNGTSQGSISHPLIGTFPAACDGTGTAGTTFTFNFGQRAFEQTPPTGYKALNTANLPAPTVKDGSKYFNTVLWTGNGVSGRAITGVGFQPDFLWIKGRNIAVSSYLQNSIAGATYYMFSDDTIYERNLDDSVDSFDTDGFTVGNDGGTNGSGGTYVGWNWLAGNGTTTPTQGTIASTASVNTTAGFSIVSYTGTGSNGTVGHGLNVAPDMVITKARDGGSHGWGVYHRYGSQGAETQLQLHSTAAPNTGTSFWNGTHPTSTVFTINTSSATNNNGSNMIAYCFAEVEGYSKMSSWTGNGVVDGPFCFTGFRPSFLLFKRSNAAEDWVITDSTRRTYNQMNGGLRPNSAAIEWYTDDVAIDFTANGFKIRSGDAKINASGSTYVFMALAENPFGGDGVSPATAR